MANPGSIVPATLEELREDLEGVVNLTGTFSPAEERVALNYAYQKAVRAIQDVNPGHYLSYFDPFSIPAGQAEFDISFFTPRIRRLVKLVSPGLPAGTTGKVIHFVYRDFRDPEFMAREASGRGAEDVIAYNILEGDLPAPVTAATPQHTVVTATGSTLDVVATDGTWPTNAVPTPGQKIRVEGAGPLRVLDAGGSDPDYSVASDYFGTIVSVSSNDITVTPRMGAVPVTGVGVLWYRARILTIAPALAVGVSGRLYYQAASERLKDDTDRVDPVVSDNRDMIICWAASWLLRSVNDTQAERWLLEGNDMRSEMIQNIDPLGAQGSEAMSSGLFGMD